MGLFDQDVTYVARLPKDTLFVAALVALRCTLVALRCMHRQMNFPTHQHPLILLPSLGDFVKCEVCHRKRSGQVYSCLACGYHMHAACAKQMVNGLYMHGFKPPEKSNMLGLGAAARVATQAVAGLISGLIEGIGEGIGGALMDNIGRGRSLDGRQK